MGSSLLSGHILLVIVKTIIQQRASRKQDATIKSTETPAAVRERIARQVNTVVNCIEMYAYYIHCFSHDKPTHHCSQV
jgi:hypothetical protein